jgi:uncharacterized protein YndB with AHSA1/START domain
MTEKLTVSTTIQAPIGIVWDTLWNPEHIVNWSFASDDWYCPRAIGEEPKVGGIFTNTFSAKDGSFSFDFTAKYDVVEPMKRLVYTMGEMKEYFLPAGREVAVTLTETPAGVQVTEIFDAEDVHSPEQQIAGWSAILENLRKYTESLSSSSVKSS